MTTINSVSRRVMDMIAEHGRGRRLDRGSALMSHRGGKGLTARKARQGSASDAGSIPARSTLAVASRQTSLEAGADAIPPRLRGSDGN